MTVFLKEISTSPIRAQWVWLENELLVLGVGWVYVLGPFNIRTGLGVSGGKPEARPDPIQRHCVSENNNIFSVKERS